MTALEQPSLWSVGPPHERQHLHASVGELHHAPPHEFPGLVQQPPPIGTAAHQDEAPRPPATDRLVRGPDHGRVVLVRGHAPGHDRGERRARVALAATEVEALGVEAVVEHPSFGVTHSPGGQPGAAVRHDDVRRGHGELAHPAPALDGDARPDVAVDEGDAQQAAGRQGGQRAHPVPGVHDVGAPVRDEPHERDGRAGIEASGPRGDVDAMAARRDPSAPPLGSASFIISTLMTAAAVRASDGPRPARARRR
jgi:hypothetical protein